MPKRSNFNRVVADQLRQALINNGYKEPQLSMLMAQAANETAGFTHVHAIENNNFGGLKYRQTYKDVAVPSDNYFAKAKEDNGKSIPYAHFKSLDDFVKRWIPIAHLNEMIQENNIGAPLDARNLSDYAKRLGLNHYYQISEAEYLKGIEYWDKVMREAAAAGNESPPPHSATIKNADDSPGSNNKVYNSAPKMAESNELNNGQNKDIYDLVTGGRAGDEISINFKKPIIKQVTINAKGINEGMKGFKDKIEQALREILDTASQAK
jgi:hypothetical protein